MNDPITDVKMYPIDSFVNMLASHWGYSIPSDNLWVIEIKSHYRDIKNENKTSFAQLFSNIYLANKFYKKRYANVKWGVQYNDSDGLKRFIKFFDSLNIKMFLANSVSYSTNSNVVVGASNSNLQLYGGFLSQGKVLQSRSSDLEAKISFISTNWDINEILIDPWIAAISQQGLIESSQLPNLKADIKIYEFTKGYPRKASSVDSLILSKEITLYEAFPINREESELSYNPDDAGKVKVKTATFMYRDYFIKYHLDFSKTFDDTILNL